ncbi:CoA-transferase [Chloroflexota bacterium]
MKERLDEQTIALRAAKDLQDDWYVNLGFGMPTLVSNFVPEGRAIFFQAENGLLGYGPIATPEEANELGWRYVDGGAQPVLPAPGIAVSDYAEAFDMIRGGHLDLVILGGLQVSERGDLANWRLPTYTGWGGTIGGALDLAACTKRVFVTMTHTEKDNNPKIVKECTYALTAKECVDLIFTDLAVIEVRDSRLVLKEKAPSWTVEEIQALTEPKLIVAEDLKDIEL